MKFRYIIWFSAMMVGLGLSSCKENLLQEITELNLDQTLSPTELTAQVVNRTNVRLNWRRVSNAQSYNIEIFDNAEFSGTAAATADGITMDQLPYTISGLEGETIYYVRVQGIGEEIRESKWISATFTTDTEQIFQEVDINEIEATAVTLRWTPGEVAAQIVVEPGNIQYTVTAEDIATGAAQITGLTPETDYTARLLYEGRTRGTVSFRTILDLGDAIAVEPTDNLTNLIANANDGDVFALMPGEYALQDLTISTSISIKAAKPADRPVLKGAVLRISLGASLSLENLILDGTGAKDSNQTIIYSAGTYGSLEIENCEIYNYHKGLIYVSTAARIQRTLIQNNVIYNIRCDGGEFIDFREGITDVLDFNNNTVYNSGNVRDFFRMDVNGSNNFPSVTSLLNFRNNTFYNVNNRSAGRFLYIRLTNHQITFTNNIVAASEGMHTNQSATTLTSMSGNNYYNAPAYYNSSTSNVKTDIGSYTTLDPGFANPSEGNFTISNEDLKLNGIGAARWR
ncbi:DUF4957 domain-containing protein [Sphingobacterium corticibacterium]|uniref:Fibronectin type III domain-containing protein n=1 Tax=Sphingobacterium corticibacterium TaxID=2484746 RepID=A0A4Q6XUR2_9SPHI|nr:DUF4957 domain-containing protein [Sphingobacterium corticibacterium]RZF60367.1 fibronectin type III domain-containing protein [Sphingobacterium corticibacterium]